MQSAKGSTSDLPQITGIVLGQYSLLTLKYNKYYIGLARNEQPFNFVSFRPKKKSIQLNIRLPESEEINNKIESAGLDALTYERTSGEYQVRLNGDEISKQQLVIEELMRSAYNYKKTN